MSTSAASLPDPGDPVMECAVLGAVLYDAAWLEEFAPPLEPDHFVEPLNVRICQQILADVAKGDRPSVLSVYRELKTDPDLVALGGVKYLSDLHGSQLALFSPVATAAELAKAAERRRLRAVLTDALNDLDDPNSKPSAILDGIAARAETTASAPAITYEWAGDVKPVLDGMWLIDDFLAKSGPAVMFGHPGCGKTFLALDIAAHVVEGKPWAGRRVERGPVLYVVAEGVTGFKNRLSALYDAGRMSRKSPFVYIATPINLQAPDGDTAALIATLKHFARAVGSDPALIVIDTLSKTFGAGKENTDDMASYVANCERIAAAFDCLTLIIHHRPRATEGQNERGHSSLRGGVVTSILVDGETTKTAITVKQKDGPEGERVAFRLPPVPLGMNSHGQEVTTCLVEIVDDATDDTIPNSKRPSLIGNKRIAHDALEVLIATHGQAPPPEIPRESIDRWKVAKVIDAGQAADKLRGEFLGVVKADPDKLSDTARRTASRALTDLKSAGILGSWEGWLWLQ